MTKHSQPARRQRGNFVVGLIVGLLIGLALALGVALYIAKVPMPFINKVPQRTAEQDAAETERNKNWDPNSPLYGRNPQRPGTTSSGTVVDPAVQPPVVSGVPAPARDGRDPAAILADRPAASEPAPASTGPDAFNYFVQAGAYARTEDAETQRAKLAMMGLAAKVTEREQAGRTFYRVRVGPFDRRDAAVAVKSRLDAANIDSALIPVQK